MRRTIARSVSHTLLFLPMAALAAYGAFLQTTLALQGTSFKSALAAALRHGQWVALGAAGALALAASFVWHPRRAALACYLCGMGLLTWAMALGDVAHGLPFLRVGGLSMNAAEFFAMFMLVPVSHIVADSWDPLFKWTSALFPLALLIGLGAVNGALAYGSALAVMSVRPEGFDLTPRLRRVAASFIVCVAALPLLRAVVSASAQSAARGARHAVQSDAGWVVNDPFVGADAGTELILAHLHGLHGPIGILFVACAFGVFIWALVNAPALRTYSAPGVLVSGSAAAFAVQALLSLAVARGLLPNPASGVAFPFLSASGTTTALSVLIPLHVFLYVTLRQRWNAAQGWDAGGALSGTRGLKSPP